MDAREYEYALVHGTVYRYFPIAVAEIHGTVYISVLFTECDDEGQRHAMLSKITDHTAVDIESGHITTRRGVRILCNNDQKVEIINVNGKMNRPIGLI